MNQRTLSHLMKNVEPEVLKKISGKLRGCNDE